MILLNQLVKKAFPILLRKLKFYFPALEKLDIILKYVEDDNELDIKMKELEKRVEALEK